jgi:hypothetical protein
MLIDTGRLRHIIRQRAQAGEILSSRTAGDLLAKPAIAVNPDAQADEEALKRVEALWKKHGRADLLSG